MDQLPRMGKRELICLLLFTCNYVVSVWRGFLFLWVLGMGYVILLWLSLSLPLIIFQKFEKKMKNFDFSILVQIRGFFSQSGGLDLNCQVFEYLMMYLFDFTVIIAQKLPNISVFCLHYLK